MLIHKLRLRGKDLELYALLCCCYGDADFRVHDALRPPGELGQGLISNLRAS